MTVLRRYGSSAFTIFVMLLLVGVIATASDMGRQARYFPMAIAVPALVITIVQLAIEIVRVRRRTDDEEEDDEDGIVDLGVDRSIPRGVVVRRGGEIALWILGYFLAVLVFGFLIASPVFVFMYLTTRARTRPLVIVLCLGFVLALQIGVFHHILHVPWLRGLYPGPQRWVIELIG